MIQLVKERLVKPFVSTEARILQHPLQPVKLFFEYFFLLQSLAASRFLLHFSEAHFTASPVTVKRDLENFFLFQSLAASAYLGTRQRGAHSTDTNSPVNPLQRKSRIFSVTSIQLPVAQLARLAVDSR